MSSDSLPPLPQNRIVVGCGGVGLDFLAAVASYPNPDDKIRSTSLKVQGGGNAGNALTCAARLGLNPRIISKVADDPQGKGILEEFEADGVDTSFLTVSKEGNSPFTYIIVDNQTVGESEWVDCADNATKYLHPKFEMASWTKLLRTKSRESFITLSSTFVHYVVLENLLVNWNRGLAFLSSTRYQGSPLEIKLWEELMLLFVQVHLGK